MITNTKGKMKTITKFYRMEEKEQKTELAERVCEERSIWGIGAKKLKYQKNERKCLNEITIDENNVIINNNKCFYWRICVCAYTTVIAVDVFRHRCRRRLRRRRHHHHRQHCLPLSSLLLLFSFIRAWMIPFYCYCIICIGVSFILALLSSSIFEHFHCFLLFDITIVAVIPFG